MAYPLLSSFRTESSHFPLPDFRRADVRATFVRGEVLPKLTTRRNEVGLRETLDNILTSMRAAELSPLWYYYITIVSQLQLANPHNKQTPVIGRRLFSLKYLAAQAPMSRPRLFRNSCTPIPPISNRWGRIQARRSFINCCCIVAGK